MAPHGPHYSEMPTEGTAGTTPTTPSTETPNTEVCFHTGRTSNGTTDRVSVRMNHYVPQGIPETANGDRTELNNGQDPEKAIAVVRC